MPPATPLCAACGTPCSFCAPTTAAAGSAGFACAVPSSSSAYPTSLRPSPALAGSLDSYVSQAELLSSRGLAVVYGLRVAGREVVDDHRPVSTLAQHAHHVRADVAGAAGHDNRCRFIHE